MVPASGTTQGRNFYVYFVQAATRLGFAGFRANIGKSAVDDISAKRGDSSSGCADDAWNRG
jgi:hypothetical protein